MSHENKTRVLVQSHFLIFSLTVGTLDMNKMFVLLLFLQFSFSLLSYLCQVRANSCQICTHLLSMFYFKHDTKHGVMPIFHTNFVSQYRVIIKIFKPKLIGTTLQERYKRIGLKKKYFCYRITIFLGVNWGRSLKNICSLANP